MIPFLQLRPAHWAAGPGPKNCELVGAVMLGYTGRSRSYFHARGSVQGARKRNRERTGPSKDAMTRSTRGVLKELWRRRGPRRMPTATTAVPKRRMPASGSSSTATASRPQSRCSTASTGTARLLLPARSRKTNHDRATLPAATRALRPFRRAGQGHRDDGQPVIRPTPSGTLLTTGILRRHHDEPAYRRQTRQTSLRLPTTIGHASSPIPKVITLRRIRHSTKNTKRQ